MMASPPLRTLVLVAAFALGACGPSGHHYDDGGVRDGATADASLFGSTCTTSMDCANGGYCIDGYGGKLCTYGCDQGCPSGWNCLATQVDGQVVSVCAPPAFELCTACTSDAQCNGGICTFVGDGNYCLPQCPFEGQCPMGYHCGADPSGQHPYNYCIPDGSCSCNAASAGMVRTCKNMNSIGTCEGIEHCDPGAGGWVGCTAPTASPEVCDGLDNNCNMLIDEGQSGMGCTITVAGVGTCPGVTVCTGSGGSVCQGPTPKVETCNYADDDCDGMIDETFPDEGALCSPGVGACQRFGVMRCNAGGTATVCSVTAGSPTTEVCNGQDDDCDGTIDETFTTLGQTCTVGVAACARQGNYVCNAAGTGTRCSVTAGTATAELCNGIDDDCDGTIDETFKNASGIYDLDTACGSCTTDCTQLYNLPNAGGHCVASTTAAQCQMVCDAGAFDLDRVIANGCEFVLDPGAIYVSIADPAAVDDATCGLGPVGTGAGNHPCRTIAQGIARATALARARILVANGTYTEAVTIPNGKSLLGGYFPDNWQRDIAATGTVITGVSSSGVHDRTVIATNITAATLFEGFAVYGSVNSKLRGDSYAIYVSGSSNALTIRSNQIFGGRGGPGAGGSNGANGATGANGAGRNPDLTVADATYDAFVATGTGECALSNNRQYANGGVTTCGGDDVSGGDGGGNRCPAATTAVCTGCNPFGCSSCTFVEFTAIDGVAGQPGNAPGGGAAGNGEWAGDDMIDHGGQGAGCYLPPADPDPDPDKTYGLDGDDGASGAHGGAVAGCTSTVGSVVSGNWVGALGGAGLAGANGGGGGGGGAGGGSHCDGCSGGKDNLGGHGGGGGAGGCGGGGGGAGASGGGAFGIFIVGGATAPVITNNTLLGGQGGVGGVGGAGGGGGTGGAGAPGGTAGVPVVFCADLAGRGGNGGSGGDGSGGGGGCGGSTFGIYTSGLGTSLNYCQAAAANTFNGGAGGAGGAGGYSIINPGSAGATGTVSTCSFN